MLIAACHVLHRLSTPRHPLEALSRLIVLSKTHARGPERPPPRALYFSQTMMSFIRSALPARLHAGLTLHSRCQSRAARMPAGISYPHLIARWWSQTGSNRRPHACKARALPTELWPPECRAGFGSTVRQELVGPDRLELSTLRLSGVRSNHLSYGPLGGGCTRPAGPGARWARDRARTPAAASGEVERETETATSRTQD